MSCGLPSLGGGVVVKLHYNSAFDIYKWHNTFLLNEIYNLGFYNYLGLDHANFLVIIIVAVYTQLNWTYDF